MKKTISPEQRVKFLQKDIRLDIHEENNELSVSVRLDIPQQDYPKNAEIILEAHNRINIERLELGCVGDYDGERKLHSLPSFKVSERAKISFRLKIIDPVSFKLLGYAENMMEEKYRDSLLRVSYDINDFDNIYRLDLEDLQQPILYLNPRLAEHQHDLALFIAEMVFKEILDHLLSGINKNGLEEYENHKWFRHAEQYQRYKCTENTDLGCKLQWRNDVLHEFAGKQNLIQKITQKLQTK